MSNKHIQTEEACIEELGLPVELESLQPSSFRRLPNLGRCGAPPSHKETSQWPCMEAFFAISLENIASLRFRPCALPPSSSASAVPRAPEGGNGTGHRPPHRPRGIAKSGSCDPVPRSRGHRRNLSGAQNRMPSPHFAVRLSQSLACHSLQGSALFLSCSADLRSSAHTQKHRARPFLPSQRVLSQLLSQMQPQSSIGRGL